jgi:hypothetical protein
MGKIAYWAIGIISLLLITGIFVILKNFTLDVNNSITLLGVVIAYLAIVWGVYSLQLQLLENNKNVEKQLLANSDSLQTQLQANNEWNKRHTALLQVYNRETYTKAIATLNKKISYQNLTSPMSEEKIHEYLCGNTDCYHELLELTGEGIKIRRSIRDVLNYYEYLASGIQSHIFDEKTVKTLIQGSLYKAENVFNNYISHIRSRHEETEAYVQLQALVNKWKNEDTQSPARQPII